MLSRRTALSSVIAAALVSPRANAETVKRDWYVVDASNKTLGRLATELARPDAVPTLYVLDEPTTGLHFHDVGQLAGVLQRLVDAGHTVVVIEHQPDLIAQADWEIELGPAYERNRRRRCERRQHLYAGHSDVAVRALARRRHSSHLRGLHIRPRHRHKIR